MPIYQAKNNKRMGEYFPSIYEKEMERKKMETKTNGNPESNYWAGDIRASVWKNAGKDKDGKKTEFLSVKVVKAYKDVAGNWKDTSSFSTTDLLNVSAVCQKVYADLRIFSKDAFSKESK